MAGEQARGASLYVTLEPCCHHGETPPCVDLIINCGIREVIIGVRDPDPRVVGQGVSTLEEAGIKVTVGMLEQEASRVHQGFFTRIQKQRPFITLKLATSIDGKIARADGTSQWITNEQSRAYSHYLRAKSDAILVGKNTYLRDKPQLNCRLPGLENRSPKRIVLGQVDADASWTELTGDLNQAMHSLADQGINYLLVEGGAHTAAAFIEADLVDCIYWFESPDKIGPDGLDAIAGYKLNALDFTLAQTKNFGADLLRILQKPE